MDREVADYCRSYELLVDYDPDTNVYRIGRGRNANSHQIACIPVHGAREALVCAAGFTHDEHDEHERCQRLLEEAQPR